MSSPLPQTNEGKATPAGKRLGHYEVEGLIGAGGMGEVYLARDTRLQRAVALKMLPPESSLNPERLARLEREARMLATLNHLNVAAIHGLEQVEGTRFLVLELVEGQTLAERLRCGPLAPEEALEVCRQLAEGVEAAHEKGVIHRDLKPANIKLTPEGKVKVLDFGLAKGHQAIADPDASTIAAQDMTRQGMVLGTPAYMSPEQALGRPLDKRTDIWAFGCVVYECLTGQRAFQGETATETLAAILKGEPDWQVLPPATPHPLRALLHRCLQKDPRERLHDIADARLELEEQIRLPSEPLPMKPRLWRGALAGAGLAAFVLGIVLGAAALKYYQDGEPRSPQSVARPDGKWLAYVSNETG